MTTTLGQESLIRAAARDNAHWCAAMCRVHGVQGEFGSDAWTAPRRTPLRYPDAVTLAPGTRASALVPRIDTTMPGATVKDSFADLALADHGFTVLFEARWIHRPAGAPARGPDEKWDVVREPAALRAWAWAWSDGQDDEADLFWPGLLTEPGVCVLAGTDSEGRVVAGAVASVHESGDRDGVVGVVGVSNVFAADGDLTSAWPGVLDTVHALFPGRPLVGYEQGDALTAALHQGFAPIGPLRVWLHA
ncbi:hypothetical protein G3I40_38530 [Streptomyces sp. SID14478]|uniref:hypothetical protein n=1 Tax=Streptomyces sp. SID14478 TaxID=2706073 RepID=UPI0013DEA648|nr:hypothetical protein [Streptomyces sp. SID14478]NEB81063.1 hypothetical protein [Streptomyces sp. SID14478]